MTRPIVVQKYGGSSVASIEKLRAVARLIAAKKRAGYDVVAVVSAMGDTTDELLDKARAIAANPDRRELDMLLSAGERISMSLLAIAIREEGLEAVSLTGSQSGIITTANHTHARIMEVRPFRVQDELERDRVVIVAGYQGVSYSRDVTTLGRGGSDTTAVALAAALDAEACEIYSDVEGVFTADPRVVTQAVLLPQVGYEEMQELAEAGARVLNAEAVEFAKRRGIAIYARKTGSSHPGTVVRRDIPRAPSGVRGIAFESRAGWVSAALSDPGVIPGFVHEIEELGGRAKQLQFTGDHRENFSAVIGLEGVVDEPSLGERVDRKLGAGAYRHGRGTVSLIGDGITGDHATLGLALRGLADLGVRVSGISTSSFRISFVMDSGAVGNAAKSLHEVLGLHRPATDVDLGDAT